MVQSRKQLFYDHKVQIQYCGRANAEEGEEVGAAMAGWSEEADVGLALVQDGARSALKQD